MRKPHSKLVLAVALSFLPTVPLLAASTWDEAVTLFNQRNYKAALTKFRAAYQQQLQPANCCYYQGLCYQQLGDGQHAQEMFKFASSNFPQTEAGRLSAAALLMQTTAPSTNAAPKPSNSSNGLQQPISIPFGRSPQGHILVDVAINGTPVTMMFDTGAMTSMISRAQITRTGVQLQDRRSRATITGVGGQIQAREADAIVRLGALQKPIRLYIDESKREVKSESKDLDYGLLGQDFFGNMMYRVDYRNQNITFLPEGTKVDQSKAVPFRRNRGHILLTAKINGRECECILDTGASLVCLSDKQLAGLEIPRPTDALRGRSGGVGGQRVGFFFPIRSIQVGSVEQTNVLSTIAVDSAFPEPLLGASFFGQMSLTIDPIHKLVSFEN